MNKDEVFLNEAYIHYNYFKKIARRLTQNEFDADDLVQDTFIRAYKFMDSFETGSNCKAWLFRIMKNLFINFNRKKQAHPHYSMDSVTNEPSVNESDPAIRYYEIVKFMEKIKEEYRVVILLYHLRENSLIEISKKLDWPLGTVKSRLHRARKEFRKVLTGSV